MFKIPSTYWLILPIAVLVTFGQLLVKWRSASADYLQHTGALQGFARFVADPVILCAYLVGLAANLGWLYVLTKLPLTVAFPVYMGVTFIMILLGGWIFLAEAVSVTKIVAVMLIFAGMVLALKSNAP